MDVNVLEPQSPPTAPGRGPAPGPAPAPAPVELAKPQPQWMHYGDMIRILGTIVVVVGHVSDLVLYSDGTKALGTQWWVANLWDAAARWAVPIYIMLSGSLLLDPHRTESPSKFYHKRLMRIGVPLVFWSLFFMWVDVYYTGWQANHDATFSSYEAYGDHGWVILWPAHSFQEWFHYLLSINPAPPDGHTRWEWFKYLIFLRPKFAWLNLLKGEPYVHMHFIFRIAGLYAFTPLIRVCLKHVSRGMLLASVATMLALSSADSVANNITGTELSAFARFVPFLGYYLAGYLLRETHVSRLTLAMCWLGLIASIAALAGGTGLIFSHYVATDHLTKIFGPPSIVMILYDFLSPVRVIMALCSWIVLVNLFKDPWPRGERGRSIIRFWANTTLGLYLIHPFFREMWFMPAPLWLHPYIEHVMAWPSHPVVHQLQYLLQSWMKDGINATWPTMAWGVPVSAALVYVPSLISAIIIMRIPFVRRIAG